MEGKELNQPWREISVEYRKEQAKLNTQSRGPPRVHVPAGEVILMGGTGGTAPHDAQAWKAVLYDTADDDKKTE
jgi:hypothetical protein